MPGAATLDASMHDASMHDALTDLLAPAALPADDLVARLAGVPRFASHGRVTRVVGLVIEASGLDVGLGELCRVTSLNDAHSTLAEVVGFHERGVLLMPLGDLDGLHPGSRVTPLGRSFGVDVGPHLLGRVLNGLGHPIDGLGKLEVTERVPLSALDFGHRALTDLLSTY